MTNPGFQRPMAIRADTLDAHHLRRLIESGRGLVSELDLKALLERLLEVARELTGARYAALGILNSERTGLEDFLTLGVDEKTAAAIGDLPRGRGVLGLLIDDPKPLRLSRVGSHPRSYGFPAGHPPMGTFLGVPVMIRGEAWGNLYLTEKQGAERFDEADEQSAVILADWAAIAIENARLYQREEERRAELEHAVRGLEATSEVARAVGAETDLNRVLETIVKRARALVEARSLIILLAEEGRLEVVATAGEVGASARGRSVPIEGSAIGGVLRTGSPERVSDVTSRLRIHDRDLGIEARSALLVPLVFRGRSLGVIVALDRISGGPDFGTEDERLLLSFAASAATAVATAQSVAAERLRESIAVAERERGRWAAELHDETLQALGALRVLIASALEGDEAELRRTAEAAVDQLSSEIKGLRDLIGELRPAALDEFGLAAALSSLIEQREGASGIEIESRLELAYEIGDAVERLDPDVETTVYRVVQESLNNVVKHSAAAKATVRVIEDDGRVSLTVADDGRGFDPERSYEGFGLRGMRERVDAVGGSLELRSTVSEGTSVSASVPALRSERPPLRRVASNGQTTGPPPPGT